MFALVVLAEGFEEPETIPWELDRVGQDGRVTVWHGEQTTALGFS
ncbi:MAG TPA: hypothetical protein VIS96_07775 [Terrimicrobiaceae bacterium]